MQKIESGMYLKEALALVPKGYLISLKPIGADYTIEIIEFEVEGIPGLFEEYPELEGCFVWDAYFRDLMYIEIILYREWVSANGQSNQ